MNLVLKGLESDLCIHKLMNVSFPLCVCVCVCVCVRFQTSNQVIEGNVLSVSTPLFTIYLSHSKQWEIPSP
jgi:hypothetical protein